MEHVKRVRSLSRSAFNDLNKSQTPAEDLPQNRSCSALYAVRHRSHRRNTDVGEIGELKNLLKAGLGKRSFMTEVHENGGNAASTKAHIFTRLGSKRALSMIWRPMPQTSKLLVSLL